MYTSKTGTSLSALRGNIDQIISEDFRKKKKSINKTYKRLYFHIYLLRVPSFVAAAPPESLFSFPWNLLKNFIFFCFLPSPLSSRPLPATPGPISWFLHLCSPITVMSTKNHTDKLISLKLRKGQGHSTKASITLPLSHDNVEQQFLFPFIHSRVRPECFRFTIKAKKLFIIRCYQYAT